MAKSINITVEEAQLIIRKMEYNWKKTSKHPLLEKLINFINEESEEKVSLFTESAIKGNEFLKKDKKDK